MPAASGVNGVVLVTHPQETTTTDVFFVADVCGVDSNFQFAPFQVKLKTPATTPRVFAAPLLPAWHMVDYCLLSVNVPRAD